jgi:hypothetical protein
LFTGHSPVELHQPLGLYPGLGLCGIGAVAQDWT